MKRSKATSSAPILPAHQQNIQALAERKIAATAQVQRALAEMLAVDYQLYEVYEAQLKGRRSA